MPKRSSPTYTVLELDGVRYAVLRESVLRRLAKKAGVVIPAIEGASAGVDELSMDDEALAKRLVARRKGVGLTQADLARRAGVRVETLNRIERGKSTPDFATIRKLITAIHAAEE